MSNQFYTDLLDYCTTDRQKEIIKTRSQYDTDNEAALAMNLCRKTINNTVNMIKKRAAIKGYSPEHNMTKTVPDNFLVKGVSTYYDDDGNVRGQWVKSVIDPEKRDELIKALIDGLKDELPKYEPVPTNANIFKSKNLLSQYTITDHHLGMLAWSEETGDDDYDTDKAEELLMKWIDMAIEMNVDTKYAVLAQLGDFLHYDGMAQLTPTSGHLLDSDSRFQKMVRVSIRVLRYCVDKLLRKHDHVHIIMATGNHDLASSVWLREIFSHVYENEPRVTVDTSPDIYYSYEFGQVSLFYHHGHKANMKKVSDVMIAKFRELYGRTKYSYCHMGHLHHRDVKELNTMIVEQHRTLASSDAHASNGGYISDSDAPVIVYDKNYGEVSRVTITKNMINALYGEVE